MKPRDYAEAFAALVLSRTCHICGDRLPPGRATICTPCLTQLPRTGFHRLADNPMERRFLGKFPFERASGHFFYMKQSAVAMLVQDFKYRHFRGLARVMGRIMGEELLTTGFITGIDTVMPVPMHWWKKARRGYNQVEELAEGFSGATGIPVARNLRATRPHKVQALSSLAERLENAEGVFRLERPCELEGKSILLLDDICTTGATLTSAADAVLEKLPDARLSLLTLAVTF